MGHTLGTDIPSREIGATDPSTLLKRKKGGGSRAEQAKRFNQIERENDRLWELIADLSIDNAIPRGAAEGDHEARYSASYALTRTVRTIV